MRGMIEGAQSLAPVVERLPAVLQDDEFLRRFTAAFDDAFAPVFMTLDALAAYLDPALAPTDFVDWLLAWVAIDPDDRWPLEQRRAILAQAVALHRRRGTVQGVADAVRLAVGGEVEVTDSGGASWSRQPGSPIPGQVSASVTVRVRVPDAAAVDTRHLADVVASVKPAHAVHTVEVLEGPDGQVR